MAAAALATSLVTAQGTWTVGGLGGSPDARQNFWQVFVRPAGGTRWALVTPPGVADNGGLVAASGPASLLIGVRPSQSLTFSPLATSSDTGKNRTPGVLNGALADAPDALSVAPSGRGLALLANGAVDTSTTTDGPWTRFTTVASLAASAAGRECGLTEVDAVSFGINGLKVVAGTCARRGVAGVFTDTNGAWQANGPELPMAYAGDQVRVLRLSGTTALLAAGPDLLAAWWDGQRWTVSAPVAGAARYEALAVSGAVLTVWRVSTGSWTKAQVINVPTVAGSSS
jgi:hypothetical protein